MALWTLEPRGDERADWRSALLSQQILLAMTSLVSRDPKPIPVDALVLTAPDPDDEIEEGEEPEATPEEIEQDIALLSMFGASLRRLKPGEE